LENRRVAEREHPHDPIHGHVSSTGANRTVSRLWTAPRSRVDG
jgi:hypothetical protein